MRLDHESEEQKGVGLVAAAGKEPVVSYDEGTGVVASVAESKGKTLVKRILLSWLIQSFLNNPMFRLQQQWAWHDVVAQETRQTR